jgi:hypothetical protein
MKYAILLLTLAFAVYSCGKPEVDITGHSVKTYEPKIVVQGYLFPNQPVEQIKISRNFPLDGTISDQDILIRNANAFIIDENGQRYRLSFNRQTGYYEYTASDLVIDYGKTYTLDIMAGIDGEVLRTSTSTTVPQPGFRINEEMSQIDSLQYREVDSNGELKQFFVSIERSPEATFYTLSMTALVDQGDTTSFITDNVYGAETDDLVDDFNDFKYQYNWIQDTPATAGQSVIDIFWFMTWFYGEYRVVVYAGDRNFKDYISTFNEVQEIDGNFHEPAFHFDGDGIGVFGSAIADTVYIKVTR